MIRYEKEEKANVCDKDEFEKNNWKKFIKSAWWRKIWIKLDFQKFNNNCYEINCFLLNHNLFLRVFELRSKFRYLTVKNPKKQNIIRQLSSCITEKYNGFQTISTEFATKTRKKLQTIDIINKPTKNPEKKPLCYFTEE